MEQVISLTERRHKKVFKESVDSITVAYSELLLESIRKGEKPPQTFECVQHVVPARFVIKQFKVIVSGGTARLTFVGKYANIDQLVSIVYTWS
jgi:hypothetical protein